MILQIINHYKHMEYYFETSSTLICVILLGKYIESLATTQTSTSLESLKTLSIPAARLLEDESESMIPIELVFYDDIIKVSQKFKNRFYQEN